MVVYYILNISNVAIYYSSSFDYLLTSHHQPLLITHNTTLHPQPTSTHHTTHHSREYPPSNHHPPNIHPPVSKQPGSQYSGSVSADFLNFFVCIMALSLICSVTEVSRIFLHACVWLRISCYWLDYSSDYIYLYIAVYYTGIYVWTILVIAIRDYIFELSVSATRDKTTNMIIFTYYRNF